MPFFCNRFVIIEFVQKDYSIEVHLTMIIVILHKKGEITTNRIGKSLFLSLFGLLFN